MTNHPQARWKLVTCATATLLLAACAVGPNFKQPTAPAEAGYNATPLATETTATPGMLGDAQHFVPSADIPGQWWTLFHSEPLDALVKRALHENPTLAAADAALRATHEDLLAQRGSLFPSVGVDASRSEIRTATGTLAATSYNGAPQYALYTGAVSVSYSPDVFGRNRRANESVAAKAEMQRFETEAAYLSLTSNVVMAAVREAGLRSQVAAQQDIVDAESKITDLLRQQYQVGEVAQADFLQQQAVLAQAREMLLPLQQQLALQRNALKALAGSFPNQAAFPSFDLATLQLPQELPVSLPSQLVAQRPDIRAAAANLHAASADIGVAIADRLPQITLMGTRGSDSMALGKALLPGSQFFTLAGGLTMPIFEGGTLLHRERASRARFDQAAAQYRATVISAFQDVSNALQALQFDADTLQAATTTEQAAAHSLELAREQMKLGAYPYLSVLAAERSYQMAQLSMVQAQMMRLSDTAALFQALGGGWWNRDDAKDGAKVAAGGR